MKFEHLSESNTKLKKKQNLFKFEIENLTYMGYDFGQKLTVKTSNVMYQKDEPTNNSSSKLNFKFLFFFFILLLLFIFYFYLNLIIGNVDNLNFFEIIFDLNNVNSLTSFNKKFYSINLYFNSLMIDIFKNLF